MEKLIITVAGDSRTSYPHNHLCPSQEDIPGVAQQYIDAVNAGAAIAHIHGRRTLEETIQADGRQVSRIHHEDWKKLQDAIMSKVDPIMQFGVASARIEEKIKLMELGPDMMAVCFNAHDEYFQPEPSLPPKRMMAIHPVEELMAYAKAAEEHKVKLECECFTTGAFWHLEFVRKQGYLRENTYTTPVIGLGGNNFGGRIDFAASSRVVGKAIELGINLIDTADSYGDKGGSEEWLGRILGEKRKAVVLASKL